MRELREIPDNNHATDRLNRTTLEYLSRFRDDNSFRLATIEWLCNANVSSIAWLAHKINETKP